jgi:hypothetical protein
LGRCPRLGQGGRYVLCCGRRTLCPEAHQKRAAYVNLPDGVAPRTIDEAYARRALPASGRSGWDRLPAARSPPRRSCSS